MRKLRAVQHARQFGHSQFSPIIFSGPGGLALHDPDSRPQTSMYHALAAWVNRVTRLPNGLQRVGDCCTLASTARFARMHARNSSRNGQKPRKKDMSATVAAPAVLRLHPEDNVAVATRGLPAGTSVDVAGRTTTTRERIELGHKLALAPIARGTPIRKYGQIIGFATADINAGDW